MVEEEGIDIDQNGMDLLLKMAEGDMRRKVFQRYLCFFSIKLRYKAIFGYSVYEELEKRSLNILQASHLAFNKVTDDIVYKVTGRPRRNDIRRMMEWLLNQDIKYCMDSIEVC